MARYPDAQSKEDGGRPVLEANGTGAPDLPTPHGITAPVSRPRPHRRLLHRCRSRAKLAVLADFCADRFVDAANGERPRPRQESTLRPRAHPPDASQSVAPTNPPTARIRCSLGRPQLPRRRRPPSRRQGGVSGRPACSSCCDSFGERGQWRARGGLLLPAGAHASREVGHWADGRVGRVLGLSGWAWGQRHRAGRAPKAEGAPGLIRDLQAGRLRAFCLGLGGWALGERARPQPQAHVPLLSETRRVATIAPRSWRAAADAAQRRRRAAATSPKTPPLVSPALASAVRQRDALCSCACQRTQV